MDILLNDILQMTSEEVLNSKIELNMTAGRGADSFIDRWLPLETEIKESGITDCSYWGWSGKKRNFFPGQIVLSFIKVGYDEWLFISAGKILEIPQNNRAKVNILTKYMSFFGRLIISYKKGNTYSRYVFKLKDRLPNIKIKELLPCLYSGDKFEGYDKVNLRYSQLEYIFSGKILPTYYEALQKVAGVYCLTDTNNGKLYIGSATGVEGVKQRWGNYLSSKHGNNVKLRRLYEDKGEDYFKKYFTFTILEYFGLSYDADRIQQREQFWKKCFDTIKNGYNDN